MPCFEELFMKSKGQPILYKDKVLSMGDFFPIKNGETIRIVIESVRSEWRQGLFIETKGFFLLNEKKFLRPLVIWQDTAPDEFILQVFGEDEVLLVRNVWDFGNGVMQSWHNGAAMIVEELKNGRRYLCNDGHPDENFDDIIFRIERV